MMQQLTSNALELGSKQTHYKVNARRPIKVVASITPVVVNPILALWVRISLMTT
jgi:hypothetical protein